MTADDPILRQLIASHEGVRPFAYTDTVGKVTVGIGRNLTDVGLSQDEIHYLLTNDLNTALADLTPLPWFRDLDPDRQRAVVDLRFQLGWAGLRKFPAFLAAMERGDYNTASKELLRSRYALQVPIRAHAVATMIQNGTVNA